jgi:metallo-beta-lactamase family protein
MQLQFHGAVRTVTGSKHLIDVNGTRLLLDCGLYQGKRADSQKMNLNFDFDPKTVDIVILSHAHIDHSGNIPNLVKQGFTGDIICTSATRDLCATMLPDSGYIQERDIEFVNKRRKKRGEPPVDPIYTHEDALQSLGYFMTRGYNRPRRIAPGVTLTFKDAGHMLGSAIIILDIEDHDDNRAKRLVFSGDLGREGIPIIRDPEMLEGADILIMESTYGNRLHESYEESEKKLEHIVVETHKRGGSIVMPAFAVGRTQQLVLSLHQLSERGDIPHIPIYVDSPLAVNATSVFQLHPECYDKDILGFMSEANVRNPFGFNDLTYVRKLEESKRINHLREPSIIISASGMAEFGRIRHHLSNRIENPRNTVLITGWQAAHTLGRRLVDGVKDVRIFGEEYTVKAQVEVLYGFSGHADYEEMLNWIGAMKKRPKQVFLVHGEEQSCLDFEEKLHGKFNGMQIDVPVMGQKFTV